MSIYILEDDIIQGEKLKSIILALSTELSLNQPSVFVTSRPNQFLQQIAYSKELNLYFLDIEIKNDDLKGLEVAQKIRKWDEQGLIVFVTTHSELAPISYKYMVSALTFIEKSLAEELFREAIKSCLEVYEKVNRQPDNRDMFIYDTENTSVRLAFSEIESIMTAEPHRLEMVTSQRIIRFYGELKEIEQMDSRLIRCHQSYIVNLQKISEIHLKKRLLLLTNGIEIPVSRRQLKKVKETWSRYYESKRSETE